MPPKKFVPRVRKQGALRRLEANAPPSTSADSNAVEIIPVSKDKREARRQQLREEIRARQPESKASSKKKKRLEKYIVCVLSPQCMRGGTNMWSRILS